MQHTPGTQELWAQAGSTYISAFFKDNSSSIALLSQIRETLSALNKRDIHEGLLRDEFLNYFGNFLITVANSKVTHNRYQ